jgi:TPR repeat protein
VRLRGVPQDEAQAVAWYRKAADQGAALTQTNLGAMYEGASFRCISGARPATAVPSPTLSEC